MSQCSWHNYGRGFAFSELEAECAKKNDPITVSDVERLLNCSPIFAEKLKKNFREIGIEKPELEDYEEWDECCNLGLASLFAEVVSEAEGLQRLYACDDCNSENFVLFGVALPWDYNDKERVLEAEDIEEIFQTYLEILKPGISVSIGDQEVENYG